MKNPASEKAPIKIDDPSIRILKIATCLSLSGRSTLTYQIGCKSESDKESSSNGEIGRNPEIHFRVCANTGRGFFSDEWVLGSAIQKEFEKIPVNSNISSPSLNVIFRRKSVNTSGFLLAVLKAEGLVAGMKDKQRYYRLADSSKFVAEVKSLMASSIRLKADDKSGIQSKMPRKAIQTGKAKKA